MSVVENIPDDLMLAVAKKSPGFAMAMMCAARGQKLITLHCFLDRSDIYIKPDRVADVEDHPRGARIHFNGTVGNRQPVVVAESAKMVRDMVRNAR